MALIEPADAIFAIDLGNSRIGMAIWDQDGLHDTHRVETATPDDWRAAISDTWAATRGVRKRGIVIGSVNPQYTVRLQSLVEEVAGQDAFLVRDDLPLPMTLQIERPELVGVDRICAAAAAFERVAEPCAIASFGTAITIDCVNAEGEFIGGAILPGLDMSCRALHEFTAQLPRVAPEAPVDIFGLNTEQAINNGVVYGAVGALREIVERFATSLGVWPHLIATGGNALLVSRLADFVDSVVPDLCLMGIALAYRRAAGQP